MFLGIEGFLRRSVGVGLATNTRKEYRQSSSDCSGRSFSLFGHGLPSPTSSVGRVLTPLCFV